MHRSTFKISDNDLIFLIKPLHPWRFNASAPGLPQLPLAGAMAAAPWGCLCREHHAVGWSARRMLIHRKGRVTGKAPSALRFSTQELKGGKRWDGHEITGPNVFKMVISVLDHHAVTREKLKRPCPQGAIG